MKPVEVGVIGGGIHGLSAALHLVSQGVSVRLFEKRFPGGGPTGRSSAVCRGYYTNDFLARAAHESLEFFRSFNEWTKGGEAGFRTTGAMYLHPLADLEEVRAAAARLNRIGTTVEVIEGIDLAGRCPGFDLHDVAAGAWEPGAGYADPALTCQGLHARAVQLGLVSSLYTEVRAIEPLSGGGAAVRTGDGDRVEFRSLLIAAGPWTRSLTEQIGCDLPLTVERHVVATYGWGGADPVPFSCADLSGGFYLKPEGTELFIAGSLHPASEADPDSFNPNIQHDEVDDLATRISRRVPHLAVAQSRGGWASLYDVSPDWQPVIGEIADGVFVDAGTSGHGFKLGPGIGRQVADLIRGRPDPGLGQFSPARFRAHRSLPAGYGTVKILG